MNIKIFIWGLILSVAVACGKKEKEYKSMGQDLEEHRVEVLEVEDGGNYTYLYAREGEDEYWMAIDRMKVNVGDEIVFKHFMEMRNFNSKELDREFDRIFFVDLNVSDEQAAPKAPEMIPGHANVKRQSPIDTIRIEPAPGGLSIASLYEKASQYENKKVIVRGQVTKINNNIMNRNWVHLMDGTKGDRDDLTFTTQAVVQIGDTVTFEGTVAIDKEYGAGYVYPLIVEDAVLK